MFLCGFDVPVDVHDLLVLAPLTWGHVSRQTGSRLNDCKETYCVINSFWTVNRVCSPCNFIGSRLSDVITFMSDDHRLSTPSWSQSYSQDPGTGESLVTEWTPVQTIPCRDAFHCYLYPDIKPIQSIHYYSTVQYTQCCVLKYNVLRYVSFLVGSGYVFNGLI